MEILDFLWYLLKILFVLSLIIVVCNIIIGGINSLIEKHSQAKLNRELKELIKTAIMNGDYDIVAKQVPKKKKWNLPLDIILNIW